MRSKFEFELQIQAAGLLDSITSGSSGGGKSTMSRWGLGGSVQTIRSHKDRH